MAKGLYKMASPLKIIPWIAANPMVAAGLAQGAIGFFGGRAARRRAQRERSLAMDAMRKSRQAYLDQEITNPYANLENPYEDLTVNQQQAQFQAQQGAQARADILGGLRGAAGGSGAAALAQSLANQQTRQQQAMSASIGQQEAANQRARAQGAASIQRLEAAGEAQRQQQEMARTQNLFGIDMARVTAANQAVSDARAQQSAGLGQMVGAGIMGAASGAFDPAQTTSNFNTTLGQVGTGFNQNLMNYTPGSIYNSYRPFQYSSLNVYNRR
tara:strand:- start:131 stop:943 length:813 start_codon:yes stop_codon:yes gene_type:complete